MKKKAILNPLWILYIIVGVLVLGLIYIIVKKFYEFFVEFTTEVFPLFFEFLWKGAVMLLGLLVLGWIVEFGIISIKKIWEKFA